MFRVSRILFPVVVLALLAGAASARADTFSYTGTLASSTDVKQFTFTLASASTVSLQTFGFGGGTNAAGDVISPGGTDPFLALFSGTGDRAAIVTDGAPFPDTNPYGTSLDVSNYNGFSGCGVGQANAPTIGGAAQCGDIYMSLTLGAGAYTVVLSDGQYQANAIFDNGMLDEGFTDYTGGAFCNVAFFDANYNTVPCPNTSGAYALDITLPNPPTTPTPEPATLGLLASGLAVVWRKRRA